ncbi:hypothetical protein C9J03_02240 [Photobacterium gaetbulicola]|uniref:Porin n=1 Tax=Photobacterium gaetbulicola Gung47 TaxID=658445 RepID=A0A0C5WWR5_9GAMM|nr:hypothetical protein [Photobacterium gaetbulicola]AJR09469.1 hypothetical protein H744_2c2816 [Photobacterium gaetbulicola Gung47]PSU14267.1 hypothetical protein C9J03_02240 [Photobacterium gaetbulicola]
MKKKLLLSTLLALASNAALAANNQADETGEQILLAPGSKVKLTNGKTTHEGVITAGTEADGVTVVEYEPLNERSFIHGNWITMYKIEHFKNEGTSNNSRPVHEQVFGEGRLNFGDTGFNLGYILKKVSFENDRRDGSGVVNDVRFTEMELQPAYSQSIGKHWFMIEGIYLGKSGYDTPSDSDTAYLIGGDGFGIRPYYRYQFTDNFSVNTDVKFLSEDKSANGAGNGADAFNFYEAVLNGSYRVSDNLTLGLELFRKEGYDRRKDGGDETKVVEAEIRPWASLGLGKHRLFFKIEHQDKTITNLTSNQNTYEAVGTKYIVNYNYPITNKIYLMAEYFYRTEGDKVIDGSTGYDDQITNFGMLGLNFIF